MGRIKIIIIMILILTSEMCLFQVSYDTWHHYMLSWDGKVIKVYVDSVLSEETELSGEVSNWLV